MIEQQPITPANADDLQQRCKAAQTAFLGGVACALALEEVTRARQVGEQPIEARVQQRLRALMIETDGEVSHG